MTKLFKKWYFWVILVVVFIVIGSASSADAPDTEPVKYETVDLQQMLDDLDSNAMKAEKAYLNKYVEVTGKISNFDSDGDYISIEPVDADSWNFKTVMCDITSDAQLEFLLEKSVGDVVTIRGKVTTIGEVLGYFIDINEIN